jgi:hypothetical protein
MLDCQTVTLEQARQELIDASGVRISWATDAAIVIGSNKACLKIAIVNTPVNHRRNGATRSPA